MKQSIKQDGGESEMDYSCSGPNPAFDIRTFPGHGQCRTTFTESDGECAPGFSCDVSYS